METLIFFGVIVFGGVTLLRALLPAQPPQPQVVYVKLEPTPQNRHTGCLIPILLVIVMLLIVLLLVG